MKYRYARETLDSIGLGDGSVVMMKDQTSPGRVREMSRRIGGGGHDGENEGTVACGQRGERESVEGCQDDNIEVGAC